MINQKSSPRQKSLFMNREKEDYIVCLFGAQLDVGNRGCRALTTSLIKIIQNYRPDAMIYLHYGSRNSGARYVQVHERNVEISIVNYRLSLKSKINEHLLWILSMAILYRLLPVRILREQICRYTPWIRFLIHADFVGDIRGGDSFSDIYGLRRFIIGSVPSLIAILLHKKPVLLPQTYGPYRSPIAKLITRITFMHSLRIYTRDKKSIEVIRDILGKKSKRKTVKFCPDVAFILDPIKPDIMDISPPIVTNGEVSLIGLNISGLLYNGGYTHNNMFNLKFDYKELMHDLIEHYMQITKVHVLLVPHVYSSGIDSDPDVCYEVQQSISSKYQNRVHRVVGEYNENEIKGIIGLCDFFIGSRMHACIAALSQGIPTASIAYSRKFHGVFESAGLKNNVIDARELTRDEVLIKCMDLFKNKDSTTNSMAEKISQIQSEVIMCFKEEFMN